MEVRTIRIDNAPVNALSMSTRSRLIFDLQNAFADDTVSVVLIVGSESYFSSGADIWELESALRASDNPQAVQKAYQDAYAIHNLAGIASLIDEAPKPVVCLLTGPAIGGGLELALACQYRFAAPTARVSLPEVHLGILPGALGTQLLPRLATFDTCLHMAVKGAALSAQAALKAGIIDQIVPYADSLSPNHADRTRDIVVRVVTLLEDRLALGAGAPVPMPFCRTSLRHCRTAWPEALRLGSQYAQQLPPPHRGGRAARGCLEALLAAARYSSSSSRSSSSDGAGGFAAGALVESGISKDLIVSPEAGALRYIFLAQRASNRLAGGKSVATMGRSWTEEGGDLAQENQPFVKSTAIARLLGMAHPSQALLPLGPRPPRRPSAFYRGPRAEARVVREVEKVGNMVTASGVVTATATATDPRIEGLPGHCVGVVGGGLMGCGIAAALLLAGAGLPRGSKNPGSGVPVVQFRVILREVSPAARDMAAARVEAIVASQLTRRERADSLGGGDGRGGRRSVGLSATAKRAARRHMLVFFHATTEIGELRKCGAVIEAVFENLSLKTELFLQLSAVCKADCLLFSNTSSLDLDALAHALPPARMPCLAGLHFFSPAHVMKLVEVIATQGSSRACIAAGVALTRALGKTPVVCVCHPLHGALTRGGDLGSGAGAETTSPRSGPRKFRPGFVGNRVIFAYVREAMLLTEEGASVGEIDAALRSFGFPIGPFEMSDLAGLDVGHRIRQANPEMTAAMSAHSPAGALEAGGTRGRARAAERLPRYSPLADRLVLGGRLGMKTGRGFYRYAPQEKRESGLFGWLATGAAAVGLLDASAIAASSKPVAQLDPTVDALAAQLGREFRPLRHAQAPGAPAFLALPALPKASDVGASAATARAQRADSIQLRLLLPMVNEAFHLLGEGIVASDRPGDIDTCLCLGFGFPAWRGGPLFWAEHCVPGGLPAVEASLARLAAAFPAGAADLVPAPLLKALVLRGLGIWDLQDRPWLVGELLRGASARL